MKRGSDESPLENKKPRDCLHGLCSDLFSIIPPQHFYPSKDVLTQANKIEQATNYIVKLKERIDNLSKRKEQLLQMMDNNQQGTSSSEQNTTYGLNNNNNVIDATTSNSGILLPIVKVKEMGCCLEVQLMTGSEGNIMLCEVIRVLEEEGAEVVNASFSNNSGNIALHTLHAKARCQRIGVEATRVSARLHELI